MKRIVKEPYKKFMAQCASCGCLFEYELVDTTGLWVTCPHCGRCCTHTLDNAVIENEDENISDGILH